MSIFKIIDVDHQTIIKLFNQYDPHQAIDPEQCVERMLFIQKMYCQWIKIKTNNNNEDNIIMDIYDIIDDELGENYGIGEFLKDYKYLVHDNRNCLPFHDDEEQDDDKSLECDMNECFIHNRINRNRGRISRNNKVRSQLFFVNDNGKDTEKEDTSSKSVFIQDVLDGLHQLIYHTLRVRIEKFVKPQTDEQKEDDDELNDDEIENDSDMMASLLDEGIKSFSTFIENKRASSNRFRKTSALSTGHMNKFMTLSYAEYQQQQLEEGEDNKEDKGGDKEDKTDQKSLCFMDYVFAAIKENDKLSNDIYDKLEMFLWKESFDSDGLNDDLITIKQNIASNILNHVDNNNKILADVLYKFIKKRGKAGKIYDSSYRFFYWPYYKNMNKEWNVLRYTSTKQPVVEGNKGYLISHWFIDEKYDNLRCELLENSIYYFSILQFNDLKQKAQIKLNNWIKDKSARKLIYPIYVYGKDRVTPWEKCYGIKRGTQISIEHIISLLAYTNYTDHSAAFSSTFRRSSMFESDESLKLRHRNFYHWSKLLRELVECYGQQFGDVADHLPILYHGVSKSLVFDSTYLRLHGPLSTTAGLFVYLFVQHNIHFK